MSKLTTSQAAKLLNIHPDTLRKRAKAGKVPYVLDKNGHMQFDSAAPPFTFQVTIAPAKAKFNMTKVLFIIDRSGSMSGLERNMERAVADQFAAFTAAVDAGNQYLISNILFSSQVSVPSPFVPVTQAHPPNCTSDQGMTALYDAIGTGLKFCQNDMTWDKESAYLLVVVTDGGENHSIAYRPSPQRNAEMIKAFIKQMTATDRVTVAVNCPPGTEHTIEALGVARGNILAWEASAAGIQRMSASNVGATQNYTQMRSRGVTASSTHYAGLQGDANKIAQDLGKKLDEVTKQVTVERVGKDAIQVRKFAEQKFGLYEKGTIYYELNKRETVQPYKDIIVQDTATGKFFKGHDAAKKMLGLPATVQGDIKIAPGTLGDFKVFVQSTSYTRKLLPGTAVVRLP